MKKGFITMNYATKKAVAGVNIINLYVYFTKPALGRVFVLEKSFHSRPRNLFRCEKPSIGYGIAQG
jgi:hypothetical protein